MSRWQRLFVALIVYVPVLVLLVVSVYHVARQIRRAVASANIVLQQELERRLEREVVVGRARVGGLGTAVLEDVRISEGRTFKTGTVLTARILRIRYDWRALLFGARGAQSVSVVDVIDPRALVVRRRDGTINVQELLRPTPGVRRPPFRGVVSITGGRVVFRDYLAHTAALPAVNRFENIDASLDAHEYPKYSFSASGRGQQGRVGALRVVGVYDARTRNIALDINARDASAAYWTAYTGKPGGIRVLGGRLRVVAGVDITRVGRAVRTRYTGTVRVSGATVSIPGARENITRVGGRIVLAGDRATVSVTGASAGSRVLVTGTVRGLERPVADLLIRLPSADFARVAGWIALPSEARRLRLVGTGPAVARLTGPLSNPVVQVTARVPRVIAEGFTAENVSISAIYRRGQLAVSAMRFQTRGADVALTGSITLAPRPSVVIRGNLSRLQLAGLPLPPELRLTGVASGNFSVTGSTADPRITFDGTVSRGSVNDLPFRTASMRLDVAGRRARIASLTASGVAGGTITASGTASTTAVDLTVSARSVDIAEFGQPFGLENVAGIVFFSGRVTGSVSDPAVSGDAEVFRGRVGETSFDYARASFSADRRRVQIAEGVVRMFPAEMRLSGTASGLQTPRVSFNGSAHVDRLRAEQISELLGRDLGLTGTIVGDVQASGVYLPRAGKGQPLFAGVSGSGTFRLEDGTAYGLAVTSATARAMVADNVLTIQEANLSSQDMSLSLTGKAALDTMLMDLTFELSGLDLARLRELRAAGVDLSGVYQYVASAGVLSASGTVTGRPDSLSVTVPKGSVSDLVLNGKRFDTASFGGAYSDGVVTSWRASLTRGDQIVSFEGSGYDVATNCFATALGRLDRVSVSDVWDMVRGLPMLQSEEGAETSAALARLPRLTSGTLGGSFSLSGCLKAPSGTATLTAADVGLDSQKIESISVRATAQEGTVRLDDFLAVSGDVNITATADPLYKDGQVNLRLSAQNLDLARLKAWLGEDGLKGDVSADLDVSGDVSAPDIVGSVEVANLSYGPFTFDRLRASDIRFADGTVTFSDVILAEGSHEAVAKEGAIPFDLETLTIPNDQPLRLSVLLDQQNLSLLTVLVPGVDVARTTGLVNADIQVGGTLADPQLGGWLRAEDGTVALTGFANQFKPVNVDATFSGNRMIISSASATSTRGGTLAVEPGGYIAIDRKQRLVPNLRISADRLVLAEYDALGYRENVSTQIDAGLSITGGYELPNGEYQPALIADADTPVAGQAGGVRLSNADISFALPATAPEFRPPQLVVDPRFNVTVTVGENVVISPPKMALEVTGAGQLTGKLSDPNMSLELTTQGGTLRLAAARLIVQPGGKIFARYIKPAVPSEKTEPEIRVSLRGQTSVITTSPLGRRERYEVTVSVTGFVTDLQVGLSSDPPGLNREQMLAALGHVEGIFTSGELGLQQELGSILAAVGTATYLFAPIETLFVEKLGFEQFTLDYSAEMPLALFVSRRLFGNFYASLYHLLAPNRASVRYRTWELVLSHRIKRVYEISLGIDDQQDLRFQVGITIAFD